LIICFVDGDYCFKFVIRDRIVKAPFIGSGMSHSGVATDVISLTASLDSSHLGGGFSTNMLYQNNNPFDPSHNFALGGVVGGNMGSMGNVPGSGVKKNKSDNFDTASLRSQEETVRYVCSIIYIYN
jgi:hypothetical protein